MTSNRITRGLLIFAVPFISTAIAMGQMQGGSGGGNSGGMGGQPPMQGPSNTSPNSPGQTAQNGMGDVSQMQMDKRFVHAALQGGMAEVALGKLAQEKSNNENVKRFGRRMVTDHTKMGDDMKAVAEKLGVKMPEGLSKQDLALQAKLQALSGVEFDKAYVQAMLKDHKKDLSEFEHEGQTSAIPEVREAAQKGYPVIKAHLEDVQNLAKSNLSAEGMATR